MNHYVKNFGKYSIIDNTVSQFEQIFEHALLFPDHILSFAAISYCRFEYINVYIF